MTRLYVYRVRVGVKLVFLDIHHCERRPAHLASIYSQFVLIKSKPCLLEDWSLQDLVSCSDIGLRQAEAWLRAHG